MFEEMSGFGSASFTDKLFFSWTKPFIERSHQTDKLISFDDCG